jgi:hypothetical protein
MTVPVCDVCGCSPCANRGFCRQCREADRNAARRSQRDHNLPSNWEEMSIGHLWDCLNDPQRHPIPKSVVDTFQHLINQGDQEKLKAWLASRAQYERAELRKMIVDE